MAARKFHLTRAEEARYLARAQELQVAGVDCEIPDVWLRKSHCFDVFVAPREGNILCELSTGLTAYAIWVRLVALRSGSILEDVKIVPEWDSESILLSSECNGLYRVGDAVELTEREVLNRRIEDGLRFYRPGDVAEGWIVGSSLKPIPDGYRDRMLTKLRLTFTDQLGSDQVALGEVILKRSTRFRKSQSRVRGLQELSEVGRSHEIGLDELSSDMLKDNLANWARTHEH